MKRIGIHRISPADLKKTGELVKKGADKLNIDISQVSPIFEESKGDYWLIQKLCQTLCILNKIFETHDTKIDIDVDITACRKCIISTLSNGYEPAVLEFCRGRRFRPGNNTYFKLLKAISKEGTNPVNLDKLAANVPEIKQSVDQLKTKRLSILIQDKSLVKRYFYYDPNIKLFSIEDAGMSYYLRHLDWPKIETGCGFNSATNIYDVAVSFSGTSRDLVALVVDQLKERDVTVYYDKDYESKLLGADMEKTFKQIYAKDAKLIIVFLDSDYNKRVWPKFEKSCFEDRVKNEEVVPVFLTDEPVKGMPDTIFGIKCDNDTSNPEWKSNTATTIAEQICEKLQALETTK